MRQFLIGVTAVNVLWIINTITGLTTYNITPMFFVAIIALTYKKFYFHALRMEAIRPMIIIGLIGAIGIVQNEFVYYQNRQFIVYIVASITWYYIYHSAYEKDIITLKNTYKILTLYSSFLVIYLLENFVSDTQIVVQAIGSVFSIHPDAVVNYADADRLSYFSNEPSLAALAIPATIMPFLVANVIITRTPRAYLIFSIALLILYFAEGMTAQIQIAFAISFIIMPRLSIIALPVLVLIVYMSLFSYNNVLSDSLYMADLLWNAFGGQYDRIDSGLSSGSYISRLGTYFIGFDAFIKSPVLGQGFGGTAAHFLDLDKMGFDVLFTVEQNMMILGDVNPHNGQMIVRIPSEIGIIGLLYLVMHGVFILRRVLLIPQSDRIHHYAFMYVFGAMFLSFFLEGSILNPLILSFVALHSQLRRRKEEASEIMLSPASRPLIYDQESVSLVNFEAKQS